MVKKKILMVHGWMHSAKRYIQLKEELEKSEKLTEWPKDTQTKVVRKGKIIKVTDSK